MGMHREAKAQHRASSLGLLTLLLWDRIFYLARNSDFSLNLRTRELLGLVSLCSILPVVGMQTCPAILSFSVDAKDLNLDPHAYTASIYWAISPMPKMISFFFTSYLYFTSKSTIGLYILNPSWITSLFMRPRALVLGQDVFVREKKYWISSSNLFHRHLQHDYFTVWSLVLCHQLKKSYKRRSFISRSPRNLRQSVVKVHAIVFLRNLRRRFCSR